jgi:hypothetical protein
MSNLVRGYLPNFDFCVYIVNFFQQFAPSIFCSFTPKDQLHPSSLLHTGYIPWSIFPLIPFSLQMPIFSPQRYRRLCIFFFLSLPIILSLRRFTAVFTRVRHRFVRLSNQYFIRTSHLRMPATWPINPILLDVIVLTFGKSTNYGGPHYPVSFNVLSLHPT